VSHTGMVGSTIVSGPASKKSHTIMVQSAQRMSPNRPIRWHKLSLSGD